MGTQSHGSRLLSKGTPPASLRDLAVVGLCAAIVVLGSAAHREDEGAAANNAETSEASAPTLTMSPLPNGAPGKPAALVSEAAPRSGCDFPDSGFGDYLGWRPLPLGRILVPSSLTVPPDGGFDLLVHFHGTEPVRKQLAPLGLGLVIAGLDTGTLSSGYKSTFESEGTFDAMLSAISREVALATKNPAARPRSIVLSSWSAGYGAIARILGGGRDDVDAVILLDSLYASYASGGKMPDPTELLPFSSFARAAANGGPLLFVTHTAVPTPDYASTLETGTFLLREIGADVPATPPAQDPFGVSRAHDQNHFFLRGYAGSDGDAHCGQLRLLPDILRDHVLPASRP
ncbi:hypothetical protein [Polyangium mundeleinium]|uniref:Alpha/beta hydrolase n=1 Tax=Polyangium mundeleinium TaxID=2995306 RepID=A0ABT5EXH2_9BACT|nr:hypothetical protein [Polyangium mundeleinium]MDC0745525.1 hypothetical protein [Polyangium mundeleinium]